MKKQELYSPSVDGVHQLHTLLWIPEGDVKAVLQIVHGMSEHIERYDEFGRYLAERGVAVVGHDHLGHGLTAKDAEELGFFGWPDGNEYLIGDIHRTREKTGFRFPGVPYYILGHSMGSFLTRQYLGIHGEGLAGAVIMGTSHLPDALLMASEKLCLWMGKRKGWRYRSPLIDSFIIRGFEKKLGIGWLSKNDANNRKYQDDPMCGYAFTLNGFYHFFRTVRLANGLEAAGRMPKDLPILFTAGAEDPVGHNGADVKTVFRRYRKAGAKCALRLWPGMRHEILNEVDRMTAYKDIYDWMAL